jgi:hypothetical protein
MNPRTRNWDQRKELGIERNSDEYDDVSTLRLVHKPLNVIINIHV